MGSPGQRKNKGQPKSKEKPWEVLNESWYNIPEVYFRRLQDSLPKRVQDVLSVKVKLNADLCLKKSFCSENVVVVNFVYIFPKINIDGH